MTHKKATRRHVDELPLTRRCFNTLRAILFPPPRHVPLFERLSPADLSRHFPSAGRPPLCFILPLFSYRDRRVRHFIWEIKYRGNRQLAHTAARVMADHLLDELADDALFSGAREQLLVPVPISPTRQRKRGFNQAELLTRELHKALSITTPIETNNLEKFRDTKAQTELRSHRKRRENITNCFWVLKPEKIKNKDIILVDDVTTTGSTLNECRRVLKNAGARSVTALTLAH